MANRTELWLPHSSSESKALRLGCEDAPKWECGFGPSKTMSEGKCGKRIELGMLDRPLKTRPLGLGWENATNWECFLSIVNKALGLGWQNVSNWECLFVHRKQDFVIKMGKRIELGMLVRPSKAKLGD